MGSGRSIRALVAKYRVLYESGEGSKIPTKRHATIIKWSSANRWQERIEIQTRMDLEAEKKAKADALRAEAGKWAQRQLDVRERDWMQGEALRVLVDKILAESPKFLKTTRKLIPGRNGEPDREIVTVGIDAKLMTNALVAASKLQRLAAEMETDHSLNENVDVEDIEAIRRKRWEDAQPALADALISDDDDSEGGEEGGGE